MASRFSPTNDDRRSPGIGRAQDRRGRKLRGEERRGGRLPRRKGEHEAARLPVQRSQLPLDRKPEPAARRRRRMATGTGKPRRRARISSRCGPCPDSRGNRAKTLNSDRSHAPSNLATPDRRCSRPRMLLPSGLPRTGAHRRRRAKGTHQPTGQTGRRSSVCASELP